MVASLRRASAYFLVVLETWQHIHCLVGVALQTELCWYLGVFKTALVVPTAGRSKSL